MKKILFMLLVCLMAFTPVSIVTVNAQTENDSQEEVVESTTSEVVSEQNGNNARSSSSPNYLIQLDVDSEGNPSLPSNFDVSKLNYQGEYEKLLTVLKPGDIIYEPLAGSIVVDYLGHTSMVVDIVRDATYNLEYVLLIEAFDGAGVCYGVLYPERFNGLQAQIKRFSNVSTYTISQAINWALTQIGKPYSIKPTKNPSAENGHWYCSELIWAAFYNQGINLDTGDINFIYELAPVFPEEINAYSGLLDVVRYNYTTTVTYYTAIYHKVECNGNVFYEQHRYEEQSNGTLYCQGCDYTHSHTYFYMPDGNGRTHTKKCACGVQEVQNCVGFSQGFGNTSCNICGQQINGGGISPMSEDSLERILLVKFE